MSINIDRLISSETVEKAVRIYFSFESNLTFYLEKKNYLGTKDILC